MVAGIGICGFAKITEVGLLLTATSAVLALAIISQSNDSWQITGVCQFSPYNFEVLGWSRGELISSLLANHQQVHLKLGGIDVFCSR